MCSCVVDLNATYCTIEGPMESIVGGGDGGVERSDLEMIKKKILLPYYYEVLGDKKKGNELKKGGWSEGKKLQLIDYLKKHNMSDELILWNYRNVWIKQYI